jgi:hypothetical protein
MLAGPLTITFHAKVPPHVVPNDLSTYALHAAGAAVVVVGTEVDGVVLAVVVIVVGTVFCSGLSVVVVVDASGRVVVAVAVVVVEPLVVWPFCLTVTERHTVFSLVPDTVIVTK